MPPTLSTAAADVKKKMPASIAGKPTAKKSGSVSGGQGGRKTLQTLQPSGKNQKLLVGADGLLRLGSTGSKEVKIYKDPEVAPVTSTPERREDKPVQATASVTTAHTQVEEADTAQARADLEMYGAEEDLPLSYWKDLAEQRREALDASLHENEELHTSLSLLEEENAKINEEKEEYKSMAEKAQELAKILTSAIGDSEDETEEETETEPQGEGDKDSTEEQPAASDGN